MSKQYIVVEIKKAWWLNIYLHCLIFFSQVFGREPNMKKVAYWIGKGVKAGKIIK